jgi:D-alanyl-lipoteichoic acid acyltransferase DltB (MBOAT superfamily)
MLFNSYPFLLVFLPVVLAASYVAGRAGGRNALANVAGFASLVFYGWWDVRFLPLLLASIAINYAFASAFSRSGRPLLFWSAISINVAALFLFKYAIFFSNEVIGRPGFLFGLETIVLPLGISFFTFHQIAFLCDVRAGTVRVPSFRDYALFVSFFPHLIAGPILRLHEFVPQLGLQRFRVNADNIAVGLAIFSIGLCKKTLLADRFAIMANDVFAAAERGDPVSVIAAWGGTLAFSLQIYFDFSGYSDMAIGLSRMFGIRLPENFRSPYKATSFIEFWRRWHITLSRFLRDYLYKPLGGNRSGLGRQCANLMIVMILGGIWHGAGWTFMIWGAIHGAGLTLNHLLNRARRALGWGDRVPGFAQAACGWIAVQGFVVIAWVFFRAQSVDGAMHLIAALFGLNNALLVPRELLVLPGLAGALGAAAVPMAEIPYFHGWVELAMLAAGLVVVLALPNTAQIMRRYNPVILVDHLPALVRSRLAWRLTPFWAMATACLFVVGFLGMSRVNEFIYFQF